LWLRVAFLLIGAGAVHDGLIVVVDVQLCKWRAGTKPSLCAARDIWVEESVSRIGVTKPLWLNTVLTRLLHI